MLEERYIWIDGVLERFLKWVLDEIKKQKGVNFRLLYFEHVMRRHDSIRKDEVRKSGRQEDQR